VSQYTELGRIMYHLSPNHC